MNHVIEFGRVNLTVPPAPKLHIEIAQRLAQFSIGEIAAYSRTNRLIRFDVSGMSNARFVSISGCHINAGDEPRRSRDRASADGSIAKLGSRFFEFTHPKERG
jgi:hypothetical protein